MARYIEVVSVTAPAPALQGTRVDVSMRLKNIYSAPISVYGVITPWDGTQVLPVTYLTTQLGTLSPGGTMDISGYFTMPGVSVTVQCWSYWYGEDGDYHFDDEKIALVALQAEAPAASIVSKTISYDGITVSFPVDNVPQGAPAQLRVSVRNDMAEAKRLGIAMAVVDPDNTVVYTYADWEEWPYTGAGKTHEFVARPDFILEKVGEYKIRVDAYIHPEGATSTDTYNGILCTTVPQEIPTGLRNTSIDTVYDTYDPLDTVPYVLRYEYKGKAQSGTLQIELGTGVWPNFTPKVALDPVAYSFSKQDDWDWVTENRSFAIPDTVQRGQTYSARVTLKTADGITDSDIDYTALKVSDPAVPTTDIRDLDFTITYGEYDLGVPLVIRLSYRYKGVAQSGQASVIIGKGIIFSPVYTYTPQEVSFAHADELATRTEDIEVTLPMTLEPGQVYSVKVVLEAADGETDDRTKGSQFKIDSDAEPEDPGVGQYRVVKDYAYPAAETYAGQASQVTYEFNVPMAQLEIIGDWISKKVIAAHEDEVKKHGSQMLHIKVSERDRGLTSKDYLIVATATAPKETVGQEYTPPGIVSLVYVTPMWGPLVWIAIIGVILIVLGFIVKAVIKETSTFLWGEDGEPVAGWGETVGMMILMGLMVAMMTALPKATEWVETGTTKLVKKGKAKIEEKVK